MTMPAIPMRTARKSSSGGSGCVWIGVNLFFGLFLVLGGWYGFKSWNLVQNGDTADGTVVDLQAHRSDDSTSYVPVVQFVVDGRSYQLVGDSATNPPAYHVGQAIRVRYDPN